MQQVRQWLDEQLNEHLPHGGHKQAWVAQSCCCIYNSTPLVHTSWLGLWNTFAQSCRRRYFLRLRVLFHAFLQRELSSQTRPCTPSVGTSLAGSISR